MRRSFIVTVLNEEKTIERLLKSLDNQSLSPDEIIIVDGGSQDRTKSLAENFVFNNYKNPVIFLAKKGNRAVGRNEAIKKAKGDVILVSDAGCVLDHKWVEKISQPFSDKKVQVVAGYYKARPETIFQRCLVPYVFVMPDRIDPDTFLPATRSMAITKEVWQKLGGFPENYSHNEDYVFAQKIKKEKIQIVFKKDAFVFWIPGSTIKGAFIMFRRFAFGDAEAGIIRPKVVLIFTRYFIFILFLLIALLQRSATLLLFLLTLAVVYIFWSVLKNYRYINDLRAFFYLPLLQGISDLAVLYGTAKGLVKRIMTR